jgi:glycerol uptake facilitator-like aquaporin
MLGTLISLIGAFIAQVFLIIIFWTLSSKTEVSRNTHIELWRASEAMRAS